MAVVELVVTVDVMEAEKLRDALLKELEENRIPKVERLERWYSGIHPLPSPPERMSRYEEAAAAFRNLSRMGVTNYLSLVPDAPCDRLAVTGFRFGESATGDSDAWALWQRAQLDADSTLVHASALQVGSAFVLVWEQDSEPLITVEHASQAIVKYRPGSRRERLAGLKYWCEDDETKRAVLYLPDEVYKWQTTTNHGAWEAWQPKTDASWPIANPLGKVPLVEFRANAPLKPALLGGGCSEFESVITIQERINKTIFDRMVTAEFQAFRQRWAVGWTPDDPNQGMQASMRHLLTFEDENVKVGEFEQASFDGFIKAIESDVQAIAAITRTPTFYTLGQIANVSADALVALQSGLVAKTLRHADNFGECWEEVLRLALAVKGDERANDLQSMVLWRDIEHVTWAEKADALVKLSALGVPKRALWSMIPNVTEQDLARWQILASSEALFEPEPVTPMVPGAAGQ